MNVSVRQHIFANVPKEQSPRGRRGFQTLYYSRGLIEEEVLLLEERAQYFYSDSGPVKYQFHILTNGQAVITQIVPIPEPDEYGRKGRYLAHSLVLSSDDFRRMAYCPLPLVTPRHFISDITTAVAAGDRASGNLPLKTISVLDIDAWMAQTLEWARQWPPAELEALARLGWRAGAVRAQRQFVEFSGDADTMLRALRVCFLLCPPDKRPALTFDTYAYRSDWSRDWPFWALGGLGDTQKTPYRVDGTARRVHGRLSDADDMPFERWVARKAIPDRLEYFSAYEEDALRLEAIINGDLVPSTDVNSEFGNQFARLNANAVAQRVLSYFPAELGHVRREQLEKRVQAQPWAYLSRLGQGFTIENVVGELFAVEMALLRARTPLANDEQRALSELAAAAKSEELNNLLLLRTRDRDAWRHSLARLPERSYVKITDTSVSAGAISVTDAFVAEHLDAWCAIAARTIRPGELKVVLRDIDKEGRDINVDGLRQLLPALDQEDRLLLANWIRRYPGPAPALRATLGESETQSTDKRSLLDRFRSPFGRKDN